LRVEGGVRAAEIREATTPGHGALACATAREFRQIAIAPDRASVGTFRNVK
jgi:hypothetical protein